MRRVLWTLAVVSSATVFVVLLWKGPWWVDGAYLGPHLTPGTGAVVTGFRTTLVAVGAGVVAGVGLYYTGRNFRHTQELYEHTRQKDREQAELTREGQMTDRYATAIGLLAAPEATKQLGGIYALERIMRDSPKDHATVVEVLAAFIREECPLSLEPFSDQKSYRTPEQVQAAIKVLGRRPSTEEPFNLDLRETCLRGVSLRGGNFTDADFSKCQLERADFADATLTGSLFDGSSLSKARFTRAVCTMATFTRADLTQASMRKARLDQAKFWQAKMRRANLRKASMVEAGLMNVDAFDAIFEACDLRGARLNGALLQEADFTEAVLDEAILDEAILEKCYFREASLIGARLRGAHASGAQMERSNLTNADITGADLSDADISDSIVEVAQLISAMSIQGVKLSEALAEHPDLQARVIAHPNEA